ncbi:hypothetical protein AV650_28310 (plasmid) [Serratia fonticola]|nr:hypothetical protein AV650_28310 [Serratia fonticola]
MYASQFTSRVWLAIFLGPLFIGGCNTIPKGKVTPDNNASAFVHDERTEAERLQRCSAELEAQKTVNRNSTTSSVLSLTG